MFVINDCFYFQVVCFYCYFVVGMLFLLYVIGLWFMFCMYVVVIWNIDVDEKKYEDQFIVYSIIWLLYIMFVGDVSGVDICDFYLYKCIFG